MTAAMTRDRSLWRFYTVSNRTVYDLYCQNPLQINKFW